MDPIGPRAPPPTRASSPNRYLQIPRPNHQTAHPDSQVTRPNPQALPQDTPQSNQNQHHGINPPNGTKYTFVNETASTIQAMLQPDTSSTSSSASSHTPLDAQALLLAPSRAFQTPSQYLDHLTTTQIFHAVVHTLQQQRAKLSLALDDSNKELRNVIIALQRATAQLQKIIDGSNETSKVLLLPDELKEAWVNRCARWGFGKRWMEEGEGGREFGIMCFWDGILLAWRLLI